MANPQKEHNPASASQQRQQIWRVVSNKMRPWPVVIGVLVIVAIVVGGFVYISSNQSSGTSSATPQVQKALTSLDPHLYSTVGAGSVADAVKKHFVRPKDSPPVLQGSDGKPEIFYMGGEFCPHCAAQRWGIIAALSRFGSFSTLTPMIASEGKVPTYTFKGSTYTSTYIDFVPVEVADNNQPPGDLDALSANQQQMVDKYDSPPYTENAGTFPFISIANQRVAPGAFYDFNVLVGHDHADIVNQIKNPSTSISKGVIGTANHLTAAICSVTNQQPANVCQQGAVPGLQQSIAAASTWGPADQHVALVTAPQDVILRRPASLFSASFMGGFT